MSPPQTSPACRAPLRAPALFSLAILTLATGPGAVPQGEPPADEPAAGEAAADDPAAGADAPAPTEPEPGGRSAAAAVRPARYRAEAERADLFARWTANGLAEPLRLGESAGGRAIGGVVVAAPGPVPAAERTTVLLVGGLDGVSDAGAEACVRIVDELLDAIDRLPPDVAVVVVPWANPDGLARTYAGVANPRNARPADEDQDGSQDEDPPDDLDGDGAILSMLVSDPDGPYARAGDARFLRPAVPSDRERWRLVPEGRDDDGDGRFNEDGPGGVRLDADFPFGWLPGTDLGDLPLSQPESRALISLMQSRPVAVALFLQGNHGQVALPGGTDATRTWLAPALDGDAPAWRALAEALGGGAPRDLQAARGAPAAGHPVDWLYAARGCLAAEWSLWGPEVGRTDERIAVPREGSFAERATHELESPDDPSLAGVASVERRWARWLDDTRGGIGFVDWLPVELGGGRRALVGGWEARTRLNPPDELLGSVLSSAGERVLHLVEGMPRPELEVVARDRTGGVVTLALRVRNAGRLPTGAGPLGATGGLRLSLELPDGAQLLAGERERALGHLPAQAASAPMTWLLRAKEHALLEVGVDSPWLGRQTFEVRL